MPVTLPTWQSDYAWTAGDGYAGWSRRFIDASAAYGAERGLGGRAWLWPVGGRQYGPGGAEWVLRAPGSTRIASARISFEYRNQLFAHHCLRFGLRTGAERGTAWEACKPPTPGSSQDHAELQLADPSGAPTARELYVELAIPACKHSNAKSCEKWIPVKDPLKDGSFVRIKSVELVLVDDDDPVVRPSRAFWELDGSYIDGKQTYPLRVDVDDAGAGVTRIDIDHSGWPGPQPPLAEHASTCDRRHHTESLGARVCPPDDAIERNVDTVPMPEGTRRFRAHTPDVAGNVGERRWTVIIDRTAPTPPANLGFTTPEEGSGQAAWDAATDPLLPDGTPGSGVAGYRERHRVAAGDWSAWERFDVDARLGDEVYDHPAGTAIEFEAVAVDAVGNVSNVARTSGQVFGAPPRVSVSGRLADLRDQYVGAERAALSVSAVDDGVGVRRVWVERDGVGEIAAADAGCTVRTRSDGRPWKSACPGSVSREFAIDTAAVPEGAATFVAGAVDRAHNTAREPRWQVLVDHTGPAMPTDIELADFDDETGATDIEWTPSSDPALSDGNAGSGVDHYLYRYQKEGEAWSGWQPSPTNQAEIQAGQPGQTALIEVVAQDAVGNASDASITPVLIESEAFEDDPDEEPETVEDELGDDAITGPWLAPAGVGGNLRAQHPHAVASAAIAADGGSTEAPIEDCRKSASSGNEYTWFRIKRKSVTPERAAQGQRKYSLHMQARAPFIPVAQHSRLDVWRKLTSGQRKTHPSHQPDRPLATQDPLLRP